MSTGLTVIDTSENLPVLLGPELKSPAVAARMLAAVAAAAVNLAGLRDRALLLLGFAGAFRVSELVALDVADIQETEGGLQATIRHSKTDQEGQGAIIAIARGDV